MAKPSDEILDLAHAVGDRLASGSLTPACAKLYSQHTRLDAGQPGLTQWRAREAEARLDDAVRLLEVGFIQRDAGDERWTNAVLRAAELMEWLSHPSLNPEGEPIDLMAAAAYQLAGYPARAAGLLNAETRETGPAGPLQALLRGDFPRLLSQLTRYWSQQPRIPTKEPTVTQWSDRTVSRSQLQRLVADETASALGIVAAALRWGDMARIDAAIAKLGAVAKFMLNGRDRYSWLLAKLVSETSRVFVSTALRSKLSWLSETMQVPGRRALERYLRQAYLACKTQAWPSQQRGIDRLAEGGSFVLCTPTGSGKTTVAEIAILQRLFATDDNLVGEAAAPLVMYLVPKRALAAEVEAKLQRAIAPLSAERVVITGLYGGIDWGPTDAWLTSGDRTVLICTYEKAEALIRFLGPLFLNRLTLVVLDEAHMVQFDGKVDELKTSENRPLRLESLVTRLLTHIPDNQTQVIALSAVAASIEGTLAMWVAGSRSATPARTVYRSTRQLIGRLQCKAGRAFDIRYDLLDRASLRFDEAGDGGTPYIPEPFPPYHPAGSFESGGPEKRLRPYLFWAAMHLVAPANSKRRHAVLISIPQKIGGYAEDLLNLLDGVWADVDIPAVFEPPVDPDKYDKWQRCLFACADYFGTSSREYRLLAKGIVTHHGKMPGLMARLLVQLVDEGVIHLILATSTLSEGVNLPFEVVLLPTLRRGKDMMTPSEFANLAGRSGRPGYGTEGRCLVLVSANPTDWGSKQIVQEYDKLIERLQITPGADPSGSGGRSALASLISTLWNSWSAAAQSKSEAAFLQWLETTATLSPSPSNENTPELIETLDALDSVLLAAIVEIESLAEAALTVTEVEGKLSDIWRRSYAHYASQQEALLGKWFVRRGRAITTIVYPMADERMRLYRSGLPPRLGHQLAMLYPKIKQYLIDGENYAVRDADGRFAFMKGLVEILATHPRFALPSKTPGKVAWEDILRWWLDPTGPVDPPGATKVSDWYDYVANSFNYRFAWGVGCALALAANEAHRNELQPTTLDSWSDLGLPWIALWLKDLMVWGTLDPVAAYLLGRGRAGTRTEATSLTAAYYSNHSTLTPDEQLDPRTIRKWAEALAIPKHKASVVKPKPSFKVKLERDFANDHSRRWRVLPAVHGTNIEWIDPAGYLLASSERPCDWDEEFLSEGDVFLNVDARTVEYEPYL